MGVGTEQIAMRDREQFSPGQPGPDMYREMVALFKEKHRLTIADADQQFEVVKEEMDELIEAVENDEDVLEECADVLFTVFLYCELYSFDVRSMYMKKAAYNLQKSTNRDEDGKVTDDV